MALGKKGMFFTFMALFLVILIVALNATRESYRYREKSNALSTRIRTMNTFIDDFENDLDRELFIGGYRAQISMNSYVRQIQGYVSDYDAIFNEIFVNGTANGTTMDLMRQDGIGADLTSWLSRINYEANKIDMIAKIDVEKITVRHKTPWIIELSLNATINISDSKGIANWDYNKQYKKDLLILGLEDPLYTIGTIDRVSNLVNISPYSDFVSGSDTTALNDHLENSYYYWSNESPSYLMRFSGNMSASEYGIESMVNIKEIGGNLGVKSRSVIDYLYFGNQTTTDYCNVTGLPSWFRIDANHSKLYEVDSPLNWSICP